MLIIKMLIGFAIIFVIFCFANVSIEEHEAHPVCKIVVGIISIMVLTLLAYCIGELFI